MTDHIDIDLVKFIDIARVSEMFLKTDFPEHQEEIEKLISTLTFLYPFSYIVVENKGVAEDKHGSAMGTFETYVKLTQNKYFKILKLYKDELDNIISMTKNTEKNITSDSFKETKQDAFSDTSLKKLNDTPGGSNNPNLLSDTYLSESERNTLDSAERRADETTTSDNLEITTDTDNLKRLELLSELNNKIDNVYLTWAREIDKALFVI